MRSLKKKKQCPKVRKSVNKCLMIRLKDKQFLTETKNFASLVEFAKHFNAELSIVNFSDKVEVPDLADLCKEINEDKTIKDLPSYETLEVKISETKNKDLSRNEKIQKGKEVSSFIRERFLQNNVVDLKELVDKYSDFNKISMAYYLTQIRKQFESEGKKIIKVSPGRYRLKSQEDDWFNNLGF